MTSAENHQPTIGPIPRTPSLAHSHLSSPVTSRDTCSNHTRRQHQVGSARGSAPSGCGLRRQVLCWLGTGGGRSSALGGRRRTAGCGLRRQVRILRGTGGGRSAGLGSGCRLSVLGGLRRTHVRVPGALRPSPTTLHPLTATGQQAGGATTCRSLMPCASSIN